MHDTPRLHRGVVPCALVCLALLWSACSNRSGSPPAPVPVITTQPQVSAGSKTPAAPLVRTIAVETDVPTRVELTIDDGSGNPRTVVAASEYKTSHVDVPVVGMRANRRAEVKVTLRDQAGTAVDAPQSLFFSTPPLPADFPPIHATRPPENGVGVEPGWTLFAAWNLAGPATRTFVVLLDEDGEVVWFFDSEKEELTKGYTILVQPMANGNMLILAGNLFLMELTFTGEIVGKWFAASLHPHLRPEGVIDIDTDTVHHEILDLPDAEEAAFLFLSSEERVLPNYPASEGDPGQTVPESRVIGDTIVEAKRDGTIVKWVSLFDVLDPYRVVYDSLRDGWNTLYPGPQTEDWTHGNSVIIDPRDNTYIVSLRHQDAVVKFDREPPHQIRWILGDPGRWKQPWSDYLLAPMNGLQWPFHQHAPQVMSNGNLLLFDNGNHRAIPPAPGLPSEQLFSRAVEYRIDEQAMTVEQVWAYGGPTDPLHFFYSSFLGDANELPTTGNVLVCDGAKRIAPGSPVYARVVEVTRGPNPVELFEVFVRDDDPISPKNWAVYRAFRIQSVY